MSDLFGGIWMLTISRWRTLEFHVEDDFSGIECSKWTVAFKITLEGESGFVDRADYLVNNNIADPLQ